MVTQESVPPSTISCGDHHSALDVFPFPGHADKAIHRWQPNAPPGLLRDNSSMDEYDKDLSLRQFPKVATSRPEISNPLRINEGEI